jgi:hypothetical protein
LVSIDWMSSSSACSSGLAFNAMSESPVFSRARG